MACRLIGVLALLRFAMPVADAIITVGEPGRNLSPPTGALAGSGWQYEGDWHGFTGTAIGPHQFITAVHVGGYTGAPFVYRGHTYRAMDATIIPDTDICVWRVLGTMPAWAELYGGRTEVGRDIVLFGRGTARGNAVASFGERRGWTWGRVDHRLSWGRSWVSAAVNRNPRSRQIPILGDALIAPFDPNVGSDAGVPSGGDSGGGVFLKDDDGRWKLAGIIYGVQTNYLASPAARSTVSVALYDSRGLYRFLPNGTPGMLPVDSIGTDPSLSIISRISTNLPAIRRAVVSRSQLRYVALYLLFLVVLPPLLVGFGIARVVRRQRRAP